MGTIDPALLEIHNDYLALQKGVGGRTCTAPAIEPNNLSSWNELINSYPPENSVGVAMRLLFNVVNAERNGSTYTLPDAAYRTWLGEQLFETLQGTVRDAAFHLLWHVNELACGRTPHGQDLYK